MELRGVGLDNFVLLHQLVGVALWHIQAFEFTLVRFIALILKLSPSKAEEAALRLIEQLESRTLGQLLTELRRANTSSAVSSFEVRVNQFLSERNWLVHKSWRDHHSDLFSPERLPPLFARLRLLADEALALQKYFGGLATAWTLQQGVTQAELDEETLRILRKNGAAE